MSVLKNSKRRGRSWLVKGAVIVATSMILAGCIVEDRGPPREHWHGWHEWR